METTTAPPSTAHPRAHRSVMAFDYRLGQRIQVTPWSAARRRREVADIEAHGGRAKRDSDGALAFYDAKGVRLYEVYE